MFYRAKGRVHDMRPADANTKVKRMQATNAAGKAGKAGKQKAAKRGAVKRAAKALNSIAEDSGNMQATAEADMQGFRDRAAGMSAERQKMQQSTPGRATQIIKNRRA
jgi:hypothetical protein